MGGFLFIFAKVLHMFLLMRDHMRMAKPAILACSEHRGKVFSLPGTAQAGRADQCLWPTSD